MTNPFDKKDHKFGTEGFLAMYLQKYQLILGSDLEMYQQVDDRVFNEENPCNIYFVLKRPKITIEPSSFKSEGKLAKFDFKIHHQNSFDILNMVTEFSNSETPLKLITEYPFNLFKIQEENGKTHLVARPSSMMDHDIVLDNINIEKLDYEILYIGQAYGKDGKRTALDRLSSHETLQKIYMHSLSQNPDCDIWIMLTRFAQVSALFSLGDDLVNKDLNNEKRDLDLVDTFFSNNGFKFSEKQKINFTEAALIKYFEPEYNIEFKNNFPNENHKSYSECYDLDIRALNIEVDTSEFIRKLYTEKVARNSRHSKLYEFRDDKDRLNFFGTI
jgi:hypothetical protein